MSKFKIGDVVFISLGPKPLSPVEVVGIKESRFGGYEYTVRGEEAGTVKLHESKIKTGHDISETITTDMVPISQTIDEQQQQMKKLYASVSNITPSLYSWAELKSKIKNGKLHITFI